MPDKERLAQEWFAHGSGDFLAAKALMGEGGFVDYPREEIAGMLEQTDKLISRIEEATGSDAASRRQVQGA